VDNTFVGGTELAFANGMNVPFVATDDRKSFEAVSGKMAIEWTPRDYLLMFGSVARGFKTGGFFGGFATDVAQLAPFAEETVLAYEVGLKSDWLDGRLRINGSLYVYDREDVQQNAADPASSINIKRITNIGDAETKGVELDLSWLATDSLVFSIGAGTTDAEVTESDFIQASSLPLLPDTPIQGSNLPNYSDLSVSVVGRYESDIGERLRGYVQLEGSYRSEQDLSIITNSIEAPIFAEPAYRLWNLRLGLMPRDGRWQAQVVIENANDERYRVLARNDGAFGIHELYAPPRTWRISYTYRWN
jgi:iron complex outermembrane receptor protein